MRKLIIHSSSYWTAQNTILNKGGIGQESDTGLLKYGDGVTAWNSLSYQEPTYEFSTASGTDTYTASLKMPLILGYFLGQRLRIKFTNANTGASTINLNGLGAKSIKKQVSTALAASDILAGGIYEIIYDGTNFQMLSPSSGAGGGEDLQATLALGNTTGAYDIEFATNQQIFNDYLTKRTALYFQGVEGQLYAIDIGTGEGAGVYVSGNTNSVTIDGNDSVYNTQIQVNPGYLTILGTEPTFAGAEYIADYSANYSSRSLVDKGYVTSSLGSYVPTTRTLTINGSNQSLAANRTWTITTTGTTNRISVSGGAGLTPTIDIAATYVGQTSLTTLGTITTGTWNGSLVELAYGGTNKNMTASNGGIVWTDADSMEVLAGTATANKILLSGATATPSWSTSTIPSSAGATANKLLKSDGTNYVLSTSTFSDSPSTALKWLRSDGTNWITSTSTLAEGGVTAGKILRSDGTNWVVSTPTFSVTATSGTYFRGDGTNWITSTLILPNAATANYIPYATSSNTWGESSNLQFDGTLLGIGRTPASNCLVDAQKNANTDAAIRITNNTSGTGSIAYFYAASSAKIMEVGVASATYTAYGALAADHGFLYTNGNMCLMTELASGSIKFAVGGTAEVARLTSGVHFKLGNTTARGTTEGTNQFVLFNGTAPVGTLTNGASIYSTGGQLYVMDSAGTYNQLSVTTGTAPATNTIGVIVDYYGTSATRVLTTPNAWKSINMNGTTYKIPLYS